MADQAASNSPTPTAIAPGESTKATPLPYSTNYLPNWTLHQGSATPTTEPAKAEENRSSSLSPPVLPVRYKIPESRTPVVARAEHSNRTSSDNTVYSNYSTPPAYY
ncbi:hypothetical protein N7451_000624 [Penicillium sp. IBT 35674x]|nr:hypothetical protein N7451_000624 [Penicillium sp. IBT 35674x]